MRNYILADLKRILRRTPHWAVILLLDVVLGGMVLYTYMTNWNTVFYLLYGELFLQVMPLVVGILDLSIVYGDDFKAKTMQVAIGSGLSRTRVILAKLTEMAVILFLDLLEFVVVFLVLGLILGAGIRGDLVLELFQVMLISVLAGTAYTSLTMILIFFRQGVGLGNFLYLVLNTGLITYILSFFLDIEAVDRVLGRFHLLNYTLTMLLEAVRSRSMLGTFDFKSFLGIALYIAIGIVLTSALFKKRELEF